MIEVSYIGASRGRWTFSLFPSIMLDYNEEAGEKTFEFMWLFWGFAITRYYE